MVATAPKETLSNMEQTPIKLFLESLAVFAIKRFLEQSYVGAIVIYLDYSYMERIYRVSQLWRCCKGFWALATSWFSKKLQEMRKGFVQGQHQSVKSALLLGKGTALKMCKDAPCLFSLGLRSAVLCLQITPFSP